MTPPQDPEIIINTEETSVEEACKKLFGYLVDNGYIQNRVFK